MTRWTTNGHVSFSPPNASGSSGRSPDSRTRTTREPADEFDPANLASDLYQDELDEGLADDLRRQLDAVERAEARLAAGTYGLSVESGTRFRTSDSRRSRRPSCTADEERASGD